MFVCSTVIMLIDKILLKFKFINKRIWSPKNEGHTNFYERCDLTKMYLLQVESIDL